MAHVSTDLCIANAEDGGVLTRSTCLTRARAAFPTSSGSKTQRCNQYRASCRPIAELSTCSIWW
eukprot:1346737-Rhodomonas_salina.2